MRTEYLEYLVEVADAGSMSKAAKKLYLTQPAISNAISALEEEIGWPVLRRNISGVEVTTKGKLVVDDARLIVRLIHQWNDELAPRKMAEQVKGDVYIADTGEAGLTFFHDVIMEVNRRYPELTVHAVNPGDVLKELNNGRFHMAMLPIVPCHREALYRYLTHYDWVMEPLYQANYRVLLHPEHPLAGKPVLKLEDLKGQRLLLHNQFPYRSRLEPVLDPGQFCYEDSMRIFTEVSLNGCAALFPPSRDNLEQAYEEAGLIVSREIEEEMPLEYVLLSGGYFSQTAAGIILADAVREMYKGKGDCLGDSL